MISLNRVCLRLIAGLILALSLNANAMGLSFDQAIKAVKGGNADRIAAINEIAASGYPDVLPFLTALSKKRVWFDQEQIVYKDGASTLNVSTGESAVVPDGAKRARINNRLRRTIRQALATLALFDENRDRRLAAARQVAAKPGAVPVQMFERVLQVEKDKEIRRVIQIALARSQISDNDTQVRLEAVRSLAASDSRQVSQLLKNRLAKTEAGDYLEPDPVVRKALNRSYGEVEHRVFMGEAGSTLFAGISLGSVLLLAALGLAITYGLMGVINLAHGELMMIGAYATYGAQELFRAFMPASAFNQYLLLAIPMSFLVAALVGALLERCVIRYLYGRPLETLLATWGISLILMQSVRNLFGAQNVAVENPDWMSGGLFVTQNLVLPYNRLAIIAFAILVMIAVATIIARTRLGLFVRATTQNRTMARCVGVPTKNTDLMAFALGSGVAGLAGCALSQIGNVGPDLGQSYIVDSFLVVVVGGVGQLAGAVVAGLGLGIFNKILEGMTGAVIAKIVLLVAVIIFIQRRPQGIFALRGRAA